jgi:hypothetical protein
MSWNAKSSATFTGGSGQMAVMAELMHRKCNAAIPHVDVGTDVFAFRDHREEIARIQVKTAPGTLYQKGKGYSARFNVPKAQLRSLDTPKLFYALAVRLPSGWGSILVISRPDLYGLQNKDFSSESSNNLNLHIQFRLDNEQKQTARCGNFDLTKYLNAWESLPPLKSLGEMKINIPTQ